MNKGFVLSVLSKPTVPKACSNWPYPAFSQPTGPGRTASPIHQPWENHQRKQTEEGPGALATPEEIPGLQDKWSKDKHLVFQAQMVFIRQASRSQEARWTLPPPGLTSPAPPPAEARIHWPREGATPGDCGSRVKGAVGLAFRF